MIPQSHKNNHTREKKESKQTAATMAAVTMPARPSQALPHAQQQLRRSTRQIAAMRLRVVSGRIGRIDRQQRRKKGIGNRYSQRALTATLSATMLAFIPFPFRKRLGASLDHQDQFASQSAMMGHPILIGIRSASPVEGRLPRAREDPCLFRTRLNDGGREMELYGDDMDNSDDELRFDDSQCISVGRTLGKFPLGRQGCDFGGQIGMAKEFGPHLYSAPADLIGPQEDSETESSETAPVNSGRGKNCDGESPMETMNMPFWHLPDRRNQAAEKKTKKKKVFHIGPADGDGDGDGDGDSDGYNGIVPPNYDGEDDDDMSVITDVSLIPTYFPSDIMATKPGRTAPHHRALIKRVIVAKARAARQTVRQLKRTCRNAVGNVFVVEASAGAGNAAAGTGPGHKHTKCVRVGGGF
ncbi:hypothetical protein VTK26DRAFT_7149 [Humicola hyalothermophila]